MTAKMSTPSPQPATFDYTEHLRSTAENSQTLPKGQRTRLRITAAASRILAENGYHDLRMADVADEAGVSHGAIYRYFENKREVTFEVLRGHALWVMEMLPPAEEDMTAYGRIYSTMKRFVELFRSNIGLNRCNRQLADEYTEFARLQMEYNADWYAKVAAGLARRGATTERAAGETFGVAWALGGMVDEMLHNVFVREDPSLALFRRAPAKLVTMLSILWYRAAFAENPPADDVGGSQPLLELRGVAS
ncbi:MAG: TetR/AcrR family transcriptional regulator [Acidobacteriota bacterium]